MFQFGIIAAPAAITTPPLLAVILFALLVFLIPSTLFIVLQQRLGMKKASGKRHIDKPLLARRLIGFALYHLLMLLLWIATWPQLTSPVHSGYDIAGIGYLLLVMTFWTGTGMLAIYGWNILWKPDTRMPGLGFFLRLYLWNCLVMFMFRTIIYWFISGA